ncbi:cobalt-precorrin-5B (C(1))-methyltransferase CbiD [Sulfuracidifex tepidarius]|uniref:cobalt-precorrin-5B (C(1))-methyltransferase CbiD n=1 Tax=Sulfuracidifex tepidarius TaxID=1294262 RepID=UPI0011F1FFBA|nr:cobalt-precorrin-5B (C(1))-methyltransferase CbiD [Sulfuracidifex tepidarius]
MLIDTLKRFGITTGGAASAASKAAVLFSKGIEVDRVVIPTPIGLRIEIPIARLERRGEEFCASVQKFSGDNPDILNGIEIISCVSSSDSFSVEGGDGIGIVTKPGLRVNVGERAINPMSRSMIEQAIKEVEPDMKVKVRVIVPRGEELAEETMNRVVGIKGGISILGTTGIEYPVSDEDYIEHIKCELGAVKISHESVSLALGNTAVSFAKKSGDPVVKIGDRVGDSVELAAEMGFRLISLYGMPAKLMKVASGIMNTHNKFGDARVETMVFLSVLAGIDGEILRKITLSTSVEEGFHYMGELKYKVSELLANRVILRIKSLKKVKINKPNLKVVVVGYEGEKLAEVGI